MKRCSLRYQRSPQANWIRPRKWITDEDFEREAARLLSEVLRAIRRHQGKQISDAIAVSMRGAAAQEPSPDVQQRYIEESAIRFERTAAEAVRYEVMAHVVAKLRT